MADNVQIKKFLDQAGVGTLWTRVTEEIGKVDAKAVKNAADIVAHGARMDEIDRTIAQVRTDFEARDGELNDAILANAGDIEINAGAIQVLNGDANTAGSVAKAVADAEGRVDVKLKAITDDMGDVDDLATTNKVLVAAINEVRNAVSVGGTAAAITMTSDTTTEGALKSYTIKQGENVVGTIDIPKDMVVESGEVVTNPEGQAEGTYIKLVLANVAEPLYVNVGNLVDIYKAAAGAAQVQVAIDSATREISASIVAGSINTTELADNAVVTTKIADANVTKAKLSSAVQASLDKADAAATKAEFDEEVLRAKAAEEKALIDAKAYTDEKVDALHTVATTGNWNDLENRPVETAKKYDSDSFPVTTVTTNGQMTRDYGIMPNAGQFEVIFDGQVYDCDAILVDEQIPMGPGTVNGRRIYLGNLSLCDVGEDNGLPFCITDRAPSSVMTIYVKDPSVEHTIQATRFTMGECFLEEYIPDTIARVADQNAIANRVTINEGDINNLKAKVGNSSVSEQIVAITNPMSERLAAVEAKFGTGEGNVESQIEAAKQAAITAAAADAKNKADAAAAAAQAHADNLNTQMNQRVQTLEAIDHSKFEAAGAAAAAEERANAQAKAYYDAIIALSKDEILAAIAGTSTN